jgi:hypothetical protein
VIIQSEQKEYGGNLIASWFRDKTSRAYKLTLNAETLKLYRWNDWTAIDWEQRHALRGKPLALWLHGFYSSHAQPHDILIDTLHTLTDSGTKNRYHFKANLKTALADLEKATGIKGIIQGDLVVVERLPSPAQQRHHIALRRSDHTAPVSATRRRCRSINAPATSMARPIAFQGSAISPYYILTTTAPVSATRRRCRFTYASAPSSARPTA